MWCQRIRTLAPPMRWLTKLSPVMVAPPMRRHTTLSAKVTVQPVKCGGIVVQSTHFTVMDQKAHHTCCRQTGLYELRTYTIAQAKMSEFVQLTKEHFHLRIAHSELIGYWTSEVGGLNEVVHIWYYDSLEQRAGVRTALAQDPAWVQTYVSKVSNSWQKQDNSLMVALTECQAVTSAPAPKGVYELHTLDMSVPESDWGAKLQSYTASLSTAPCKEPPILLGAWKTVIGRLNTAVLLMQFASLDDIILSKGLEAEGALHCVVRDWRTKLLLPHAVSPLQ